MAPHENLIEQILALLKNIISKFSDTLPNNVASLIIELSNLISVNNGSDSPLPMEQSQSKKLKK